MKPILLFPVLALLIALPASAEEPPTAPTAPPSTGTAWLAVGGTSLGLGLLNFGSAAVCPRVHSETLCLAGSFGFGAGLTIFGAVGLALGVKQRDAWMNWKGPTLAPTTAGATLTWRGTW